MTPLRPSLRRTALAGVAASTAYLAAQAVDGRLAGHKYDDLLLWGGLLTRSRHRQHLAGLAVHYTLGMLLAMAYRALSPALPIRSPALRGVLFLQMENALFYPGVPLINTLHPLVRSGKLPSLLTWRYFWVEVGRHAAYGMVLGVMMDGESASAGRDE